MVLGMSGKIFFTNIIFLLLIISSSIISCNDIYAQTADSRAAWMRNARWGVMSHYLADWKARERGEEISVKKWNEIVNNFDVEGLASQLKSVGAGYFIFTIGQNSGYYLSPNKTYNEITGIIPSKCSQRDLISDLADALNKYNIKLIVYLPSGAPAGDKTAREALEWQNGPYKNRNFQINWQNIIREWSIRWGSKVAGWWFDGCYWPSIMYRSNEEPNFKSFADAARAGNPQSIVAFNPGVVYRSISLTPYEDYTAGEIDQPNRISIKRSLNGIIDGAQLHYLSFLGEKWGMGSPRFTNDLVIEWSKEVQKEDGVMTWDTPIGINGLYSQQFMDQLNAIGKAMNSTR
jgi:Alpha-L-fucosidase